MTRSSNAWLRDLRMLAANVASMLGEGLGPHSAG